MAIINALIQMTPYAIHYMIPLLITAFGGLYSERSGIVNVGLEGLMVVGTFICAYFGKLLFPSMGMPGIWLSILLAGIITSIFSLLHAFACVTLGANQTISGTAINMMASALCLFIARSFTGSGTILIPTSVGTQDIAILKDIPIIGQMFFKNVYPTTFLILAIVLVSWFVLYKTPFGLRFRACGDFPQAVDAAGVSVTKMRYAGVMLSGFCAGLGGAVMIATYAREFNGYVSGIGFLALAVLIFGQWKPGRIILSAAFFGMATTIANISSIMPEFSAIPPVVLSTFPYVVTILALVMFSKNAAGPRAAGESYDKGKR